MNLEKNCYRKFIVKKFLNPMKAAMLLEIFQLSNQSGSKVENVFFKDQHLTVSIQNRSEKKITEFIQDLTELKKYQINTDKISQDDTTKLYVSNISIGLHDE
ncbi:MAG: hypothetical protein LRY52_07760 [Sulfurospirillum cavolei]|nr:hypothetical protein [Sulfurospirillum cavolei]